MWLHFSDIGMRLVDLNLSSKVINVMYEMGHA